jgi:23S rRNA-/tRNA-specific pseudouridylate synthase
MFLTLTPLYLKWKEKVPDDCAGVVELEVDLLTGRTHQIRGQLALEGMPICGDTLYGGSKETNDSSISGFTSSGNLALQCCEIEFYDPEYFETLRGNIDSIRSTKLNRFRLDTAWWSTHCSK